jgi:hypothetical protein
MIIYSVVYCYPKAYSFGNRVHSALGSHQDLASFTSQEKSAIAPGSEHEACQPFPQSAS